MKRNLIQIALSIFLVVLIIFCISPIRNFTNTQVETKRDQILRSIQGKFDIVFNYQSLSPSLLNSLRIHNFSMATNNGNIKLEVEKIHINYNLKSLLNRNALTEIDRVYIAYGSIHIHKSESSSNGINLDDLILSLQENLSRTSLELRDIQLVYYLPEGTITMDIDRLHMSPKSESYSLRLRSFIRYENESGSGPDEIQVNFSAKGNIDKNFEQISLDTNFSNIDSDWFAMEDQRFYLSYGQDFLNLRKIKDQQPIDLELTYDINEKTVDFSWISEEFTPGEQISFKNNLSLINPWLLADISGSAKVHYNIQDSSFLYDFDTQIVLDNDFIQQYIPEKTMLTTVFQINEKTVLTAAFQGNEKKIDIDQLMVETSIADISYKGSVNIENKTPKGFLTVSNYYLASARSLNLMLSLDTFEDLISVESVYLRIGDYSPGSLKLLLQPELEQKNIYISSQVSNGQEDNIFFDGTLFYGKEWNIDGWFDFSNWNLGALIPNLVALDVNNNNWKKWGENLQLNSTGEFYFSENDKFCFMENISLSSTGSNPYYLESDFSWENGNISVNQFFLDYKDYRLEAAINGIVDRKNLQSELYINFGDYSYDFNIAYNSSLGLDIQGNYGMSLSMQKLSRDRYFIEFTTENFPIDFQNLVLESTLNIDGQLSPGDNQLHFRNNKVNILSKQNPLGSLVFSGIMEKQIMDLYSLTWNDQYSSLKGSAAAHLGSPVKDLGSAWIELLSLKSNESIIANFLWNPDQQINGFLNWSDFDLARMERKNLEGKLDTELFLSGSLQEPVLTGSISSHFLQNKKDYFLNTAISSKDQTLEMYDLNLESKNIQISDGFLFADLQDGYSTINAPLTADFGNKEYNTSLTVVVKKLGSDYQADLFMEPIVMDEKAISPSLILNGEYAGDYLLIRHQDPAVFSLQYDNTTKELVSSSKKLLPVSYELSGILGDHKYLDIVNIESKISWLNYFLPLEKLGRPIVEIDNGFLHGEIELRNEDNDLSLKGQLLVDDLVLDTLYNYKEFSKTNVQLNFLGNHMEIEPFTINVGSRGAIDVKGQMEWTQNNFGNITIDGTARALVPDGGLQIIYPVAGLNLDGEAVGDFRFTSNSLENRFEGTFTANHLLLSLGEKSISTNRKSTGTKKSFVLALNFVTGDDVRFVLPNEEFQFLEAKAASEQKLSLFLEAGKRNFSFQGDVLIDQGQINYFNRSFIVKSGLIKFNEDARNFNPRLEVAAEYLTENEQNEPVVVDITYNGFLIDDYNPVLSSTPFMEQSRILSILGQPIGLTLSEDQEVISSLVLATGSMVGRYSLAVPFESALQDAFNLDKVSVNTALMENIILEQISTEGVFSNENNQYNLMKYLDGSRLDMGKYLAKDLYLNGAIIVDSDNLNAGKQLGLDFSFSFEMATPFFDIGWNYQPDQFDAFNSDESFISDTSITLKFIF